MRDPDKPDCKKCRQIKENAGTWDDDKCRECLPEALPGNSDAERIYMIVQDQYIVGMAGAVALNQEAIHRAMQLYQVSDRQACFEKVVMLGRAILKHEREKEKKT
jgi:hypothetical protein